MNDRRTATPLVACCGHPWTAAWLICVAALWTNTVAAADTLQQQASWHAPDVAETILRTREALEQLGLADDQVELATARLTETLQETADDRLDALVATTAELVPAIARVRELAQQDPALAAAWFASADPLSANFDQLPPLLFASVRTWLGRELAQIRLYDEALSVIEEVDAGASLDPASLLFYRGACRHALLEKKPALADLRQLLENEQDTPLRFTRASQLMIADLEPLEEDSLDEVSRMMDDVTRRLDLGRADGDVQQREQTIIDKLTKLIEEMEEQQRQQQQQQQQQSSADGQGPGGGQGRPMKDSQIAGASGQGDVDRKDIGQRDGWGNLPPAERAEALQQISRDLPTHYREAIEAYFRRLATGN